MYTTLQRYNDTCIQCRKKISMTGPQKILYGRAVTLTSKISFCTAKQTRMQDKTPLLIIYKSSSITIMMGGMKNSRAT